MSENPGPKMLQKRNKATSHLIYELEIENKKDLDQNDYEVYKLFEDWNDKTLKETTHNEFNILECEKEYSRIIGVSLYNENCSELEQTLISIFKNRQQVDEGNNKLYRYLSKTLIIIIADGYKKLKENIKERFESFNLYSEEILEKEKEKYRKYKESVKSNKGKTEIKPYPDVTVLFQGELAYAAKGDIQDNESSIESGKVMKVIFAVKLKNKRKLHSHLILFQLCCRKLHPEYIVLLDTGTVPYDDAINNLIEALDIKPHLSGCCGEIEIDTETKIEKKLKKWEKIIEDSKENPEGEDSTLIEKRQEKLEKVKKKNEEAKKMLLKYNVLNYLFCGCISSISPTNKMYNFFSYFGYLEANFILKAQYLEYKFAHSLQKTFDSSCGFIPVLPGAFCAYKWSALSVKNFYVLNEYLMPFHDPMSIGWMKSNIYCLAEDRVILDKISKLDTETVSNSGWSSGHFLELIRSSRAITDGQNSIIALINQRRRWNNGAWFSLVQTLLRQWNVCPICCTNHSIIRKLVFILQLNYYYLLIGFQWCSVGAYYLAYSMALRKIMTESEKVYLIPTFEGIYLIVTFSVIALSLVITTDDLNDNYELKKDSENRYIYRRKNVVGLFVFNILAFLYFLSLLYILIVLMYVVIAKGFSSSVYIAVVILVPCTLALSLLIYRFNEICKFLLCAFPYVYYIPTYVNILQIYAICKTDDISWGTRKESNKYNSKIAKYRYKKFLYLVLYVVCNSIFGFMFERFYENGAENVLGFLYGAALLLILTPFIGEIYYMFMQLVTINSRNKVISTPIVVNKNYLENKEEAQRTYNIT